MKSRWIPVSVAVAERRFAQSGNSGRGLRHAKDGIKLWRRWRENIAALSFHSSDQTNCPTNSETRKHVRNDWFHLEISCLLNTYRKLKYINYIRYAGDIVIIGRGKYDGTLCNNTIGQQLNMLRIDNHLIYVFL